MSFSNLLPSGAPIDPSLFAINWQVLIEVLAMIVILSFLIERALALLFESELFLNWEKRRREKKLGTLKPLIAFVAAAAVCILWQFDAVSIVLASEQQSVIGELFTGGVIAGGSKGSIKLFRDVLDFKSNAYRRAKEEEAKEAEARQAGGG